VDNEDEVVLLDSDDNLNLVRLGKGVMSVRDMRGQVKDMIGTIGEGMILEVDRDMRGQVTNMIGTVGEGMILEVDRDMRCQVTDMIGTVGEGMIIEVDRDMQGQVTNLVGTMIGHEGSRHVNIHVGCEIIFAPSSSIC